MSLRHPVITGTGIICASGGNRSEVWESLRSGQTSLGPLTLFPSVRFGSHLVGEVRRDLGMLARGVRGSRSDKLAWVALSEALRCAGLDGGLSPAQQRRTGVMVGSTVGGMLGTEQFLSRLLVDGRRRFGSLRFHECAGTADLCARRLGVSGPCGTVSTACSAAAMAIALGAELIESDEADVMLVGGSDSLCRLTLNGFGSLLLLDPQGCRPFDAQRAGISLGEGAAMLVLEAEENARARKATILGRLTGWGAACDAWHPTAPDPEGQGAFNAMHKALQRARLRPNEISFVLAHGTGTPDNDAMEANALRRVFAGALPPVSSVKRFFGHTLAASGAIQAVLGVEALQRQGVLGNPGFEHPDPVVGFEPVRAFHAQPLANVLSNSFGFGGNNVALVFSAENGSLETDQKATELSARVSRCATPSPASRMAVVGMGIVGAAGCQTPEIFVSFAKGGSAPSLIEVGSLYPGMRVPVYACGDFGAEGVIDPGRARRLSRLQQMALVCARRSIGLAVAQRAQRERICVALGTGLGALNDTASFLENMLLKQERAPRPLFFTNSVHNSLASQVAIDQKLAGLNSTPVHHEICFETALWQAARELELGHADLALAGAADELNGYALAAGVRWGWWSERTPGIQPFQKALGRTERPLPGEGCVVFSLARSDLSLPEPALASVSGVRLGRMINDSDGAIDAAAEAEWIAEAIERDGGSLDELDLLLTGANGWRRIDQMYTAVGEALSQRAGRRIACGAYKQCCGEFHSASAFGLLTAIGLVRGDLSPNDCGMAGKAPSIRAKQKAGNCRLVVLYTISRHGAKGVCCVRA